MTDDADHEPSIRLRLEGIGRGMQHRLAYGIGVDEAQRLQTVVAMLANNARRAPGYWIQLVLAAGIATLGLVLSSTAVVIGAMLVSPLMGPIVELGMGFAVGSSLLVMRASIRVALSVFVAVSGAALLTLALPFHEVTGEIATRTAPTALDLLVAVFCALTAAYTTVRPGSDTTAAAAGTAIGIALVPPLCVAGFGLGTFAPAIAGGAALLFTANLSAILVLSVLAFLLLGFNQVDAGNVERDFLDHASRRGDRVTLAVHRAIHRVFGSRYGLAMRLLVPVAFLAMIFVPLRRALTEVTWEVRTRAAIRRIVQGESPSAMQTALTVERNALSLRVLVIGTNAHARALEESLTVKVARETGVQPTVSVVAVPDAHMLRDAAAVQLRAAVKPAPMPAPVADLRDRAGDALAQTFPPQAGPMLGWELTVSDGDTADVTLRHLGPPLGASGEALLSRVLSDRVGSPLRVHDVAFPSDPVVAKPRSELRWRDSLRVLLAELSRTPHAVACVRGPRSATRRSTALQRAIVEALGDTSASGRVRWAKGPRWEVRIAASDCALPAPGP